ncbi:MAG: ABC transporter ATP-binding protein [Candidatus Omnitrophica bacterium]|nr:ABC transporter ATP-binding protein [Candidatus Omnitrophota bacterium]
MFIRAENLHKVYRNGKKNLRVLKGVDLSLDKGKIFAIIGPSGAGKSTLLHILGGLDKPSKGKVLFGGIDLYSCEDNRRSLIRNQKIGFVFQFYHLLPEFSALENVAMPGLIKADSKERDSQLYQRAKGLLSDVGLKNKIESRPSELSGGEAQRVAIARALINEPDVVFCDEPTGNLDTENADIALKLIKGLNKKNKQTFLIVTHNERLAKIADEILYIKDGTIV